MHISKHYTGWLWSHTGLQGEKTNNTKPKGCLLIECYFLLVIWNKSKQHLFGKRMGFKLSSLKIRKQIFWICLVNLLMWLISRKWKAVVKCFKICFNKKSQSTIIVVMHMYSIQNVVLFSPFWGNVKNCVCKFYFLNHLKSTTVNPSITACIH